MGLMEAFVPCANSVTYKEVRGSAAAQLFFVRRCLGEYSREQHKGWGSACEPLPP
jgi:hypothetical protein